MQTSQSKYAAAPDVANLAFNEIFNQSGGEIQVGAKLRLKSGKFQLQLWVKLRLLSQSANYWLRPSQYNFRWNSQLAMCSVHPKPPCYKLRLFKDRCSWKVVFKICSDFVMFISFLSPTSWYLQKRERGLVNLFNVFWPTFAVSLKSSWLMSEYQIWSLKFKAVVTVQVYFNETEFLSYWSIFRLVVIFQLDMGDLLVELEL